MMKVVKSIAKEDLMLVNTEEKRPSGNDWWKPTTIKIKKGDPINVAIKEMPDDRTYRTAFVEKDDKFYCYTVMIKNGEVFPNCGGNRMSTEISEYYFDDGSMTSPNANR